MAEKDRSEEDKLYWQIIQEQSDTEDSGIGFCYKCGGLMEFDSTGSTLICSECGHEVDIEDYGFEGYEDYDFQLRSFPRREEVDPDYEPDDEDYDDEY